MSEACPECNGPSRVVTAVTVAAVETASRTVLVTRQCNACQLKYPAFKLEELLTGEELSVWRKRE